MKETDAAVTSGCSAGYRVPNGPAFAPGGDWRYQIDTARRTVYRLALDPDGALAEKRPFIHFAEADGYPDGHL